MKTFAKLSSVFFALLLMSSDYWINLTQMTSERLTPSFESLMVYFCGSITPTTENLSYMALMFFPIILFIMLFGTVLYDGLTPESVYSFIRQKSRFSYFTGKLVRIFCICILTATLYSILVMLFCGWNLNGNLTYCIFLTFYIFTIIFEFSIVYSILSMKVGATFSLITWISFVFISITVSLLFLERSKNIPIILKVFSPVCFLYGGLSGEFDFTETVFTAITPCLIWIVTALSIVKFTDFGLNNKELM